MTSSFHLQGPGIDEQGRWHSGLPRSVHLLGAGGAGLSGAGIHLLALGHRVTGHDLVPSDFLHDLERAGARVRTGPSRAEDLPEDTEVLVHSAAVPAEDPQRREAERRGLSTLLYAELLARLAPPRHTLAVAGTHGKTTTSWMLFHALRGAGLAPGALIGGRNRALGANAVAPASNAAPVVLEACEYDRTFLRLSPFGAIVTNVEADHLDIYGSLSAVVEAFEAFAARVHPEGLLVMGAEVPDSVRGAAACRVWQVGRELALEVGVGHASSPGLPTGSLRGPGFTVDWQLAVPGEFNAHNAAVALGLTAGWNGAQHALQGASEDLAQFDGAARRFEPWGEVPGCLVIHDYAHHPTEVEATLRAAKERFPERSLTVLFQPHQASRTAHFLDDFVAAFAGQLRAEDRVLIADVYGARKQIDAHAAGAAELVEGLLGHGLDARASGAVGASCEALVEAARPGDLLLVLGAGDIDTLRDELLSSLRRRFGSS